MRMTRQILPILRNMIYHRVLQLMLTGKVNYKVNQNQIKPEKGWSKHLTILIITKETLKEAKGWGYKASDEDITKSLVGMDEKYSKEHCASIRDGALNQYFTDHLKQFEEQKKFKFTLESLKLIMVAEQGFLKETQASLKSPIEEQSYKNQEYLQAGQIARAKPEILEEVFSLAKYLLASGAKTEKSLLKDLQDTTDLKASHEKMGKEVEAHLAKE